MNLAQAVCIFLNVLQSGFRKTANSKQSYISAWFPGLDEFRKAQLQTLFSTNIDL